MFTVTNQSIEQDGKCTVRLKQSLVDLQIFQVIVSCLQKYRREMRVIGQDSLPIGFAVYEMPGNYGPLPRDYFHGKKPVARTKVFGSQLLPESFNFRLL